MLKSYTFVFIIVLLLLTTFSATAQEKPECEGGAWFESSSISHRIWLVSFQETLGCQWGRPEDQNALQRSGFCGIPKQRNDFIVLTHNWRCTATNCPVGEGWVTDIGTMAVGDTASLCDFGTLYAGTVIWAEKVTDSDPQPQTEFDCPGDVCGTIVTSVGKRLWENGPAEGFYLVRISYKHELRH